MLILDIVGPVFLLIAVGFLSVQFKLFPIAGIAGLVSFVNNFATLCVLFRAMLNVDFCAAFDPGFLLSFYTDAFAAFAIGAVVARYGFGRRPGDSVVVGFAAYFTNTVLVGLPIVYRAYGETALPLVYAIIGLHSPLLMSFGTIVMELEQIAYHLA
jgi:predicted permease